MKRLVLLMVPLCLLASACTDRTVTAPSEAVLSTTSGGEISYEIILLDGQNGRAIDVNDAGMIAGAYRAPDGSHMAAKWVVDGKGQVTGPTQLGTLPAPFDDAWQVARAINAGGTIVGWAQTQNNLYAGYVFDDQGMRFLSLFETDRSDTQHWAAEGINDEGLIAGWLSINEYDDDGSRLRRIQRGAVWLPPYDANPVVLEPLGQHTRATASLIDNNGTVIGQSFGPDGVPAKEVRWQIGSDGGVTGPFVVEEEGYFRWGMNHAGDRAGFVEDHSHHREGALLRPSTVVRLGFLSGHGDSEARDASDPASNGDVLVVGSSGFFTASERAVVWRVDANGNASTAVNLGLPNSRYESGNAEAVNNLGWVVGANRLKRGGQTATLWMPRESQGGEDPKDDDGCNPHPRTGACRG
jgi:probable HAF family extracellular repeat protein